MTHNPALSPGYLDAKTSRRPSELVSATELAELLSISERSLYRLKSTNQLPEPIKLGGCVRWRLTEIQKWIAQGCPRPTASE